jgi:hypothetical protein
MQRIAENHSNNLFTTMFFSLKDQYDEFWNKKSQMGLHQPLRDEEEEEETAFLREKGLLRASPRSGRRAGSCMFLFLFTIFAAWTVLMYLVFKYQNERNVCVNEPPKHLQVYSKTLIHIFHFKANFEKVLWKKLLSGSTINSTQACLVRKQNTWVSLIK